MDCTPVRAGRGLFRLERPRTIKARITGLEISDPVELPMSASALQTEPLHGEDQFQEQDGEKQEDPLARL